MSKKSFDSFEELIERASKFVESQGGKWDHMAWLEFLSDMQKQGFNLSHDMQSYLGSMLESMKKLYGTVMSTKGFENVLLDISENTISFIKKTKGTWDHIGWEAFIKDVQKTGVSLTEETTTYLGGVLEAAKELYMFPMKSTTEKKGKGKE
ncbi:hypothetical protein [Candidatus Magnetomonas plexicatena]|uniref:hypothetical protein n=1 Tax=Candidatus Magnetomonas plexicatena TaxID=2552947 RepID=UPI001102CB4B|nr:hypothetical protein E2O03_009640 [Nitrospirales bacterium LBB_01]